MNMLRTILASAVAVVCGVAALQAQSIQWEHLKGPEGGNVRSLTRTPDGTLVTVIYNEGLYRSDNNGMSWQPLHSPDVTYIPTAIHATRTGTLLLAMSDSTLFGSHLYRSTDMGNNWSSVSDELYARIALANDSSGGIIGGNIHDLYRSTDDGVSWARLTTFEDEISAITVGPDGRMVVAVERSFSPRGVQISTDTGATWNNVQIGDSNTPTILALGAAPNGYLFAGTGGGGLFRSVDGGATWQNISIQQQYYYSAFAIAADGSVIISTSSGIYRSSNSGESWREIGDTESRFSTPVLALAANGTILAGTYNAGIYASDGDTWMLSSRGLPPLGAGVLTVAPDGTLYTVPGNGQFFASGDNGITWIEPGTPRYFGSVLATDKDGYVYTAASYPMEGYVVARSSDKGVTWTYSDTDIAQEWIRTLQTGRNGVLYAGVERGPNVFHASSTDGLFVSTDHGDSWTTLGTGLQGTTPVAIVELADGTLFIGSSYNQAVLRLDPGTTVWQDASTGIPKAAQQFYQQLNTLIADNSGTLYAGTLQGLYRSSNRGASWQHIGTEIADTAITALTLAPNGRIYAATMQRGLYASDDNGATWQHQNDAPGAAGFSLVAIDSTGAVIAGNETTGLYRGVVASSVPVAGSSIAAGLTAYPNPAGPGTTVAFTLASAGTARLVLYSTTGQQTAILANEAMSAGSHRIALDLSGYAAGSYHVRLETERGSQEIGIIVVR